MENYHVSRKMEERYQLHYAGMLEGGDEKHYNEVGMYFQIFRTITKDEGRTMLVESVEELLNELNRLMYTLIHRPLFIGIYNLPIFFF
jgi:hypothetical protein